MAGPGGPRPNAGRKPKAEKFAGPIAAAEEKLADRLPKILESLIDQAMGWVLTDPDEEWVPAGLVTVKGPLLKADGEVWLDDKGKPAIVDCRVFPKLNADQLVLVKRKIARIGPDYRATAYAIDRILDKAGIAARPELEGIDLRSALEQALAKMTAYRDPDEPADAVGEGAGDGGRV